MRNQSKQFAVITGGSHGIGLELAKVFAKNGFDLLISARDEADLNKAARTLHFLSAEVKTLPTDLSAYEGVERLAEAIAKTKRPVDVLALNAGHGVGGRFVGGTDLADELHLVRLNISSVIHLAKRVLPDMVARGSGRVLFTGSVAGTAPLAFESVYAASKAFVNSFSLALGAELEGTGVTTTLLMPTATDTEFFHRAQMDDTPVGKGKKDNPADVAERAFTALMEGRPSVFGGNFRSRVRAGLINKILPDATKAHLYRGHSEPQALRH